MDKNNKHLCKNLSKHIRFIHKVFAIFEFRVMLLSDTWKVILVVKRTYCYDPSNIILIICYEC